LGDVDGDGDLDAYAAHSFGVTHNLVWLNDGSGFFVDSGQVLGSLQSHEVALGDLDGDGDLDAFVANGHAPYLGEPNKVWLNDGQGLFADSGQRLGYPTFNSDDSRAVALGDVDGDGDLDVFVGNDGPNQVWLNDGAGIYSYSEQDLGKDSTYTVVLEDLDGDDDLDVVVVNQDRVEVWLNDGRGWFVKGKQEIPHSGDDAVAVGDVDGDGDADILSMNYGRGCRIWLNDGDLQFSRLCDPRPALFWGCGVGLVVVCAAIWQRRRVHKFVN
jgi:hypothetical protein